jgi:hypothetical protein
VDGFALVIRRLGCFNMQLMTALSDTECLHWIDREYLPTVDVLLLLGSRLRRLMTISQQRPDLLTALTKLS